MTAAQLLHADDLSCARLLDIWRTRIAMEEDFYTVRVDPKLADLIPKYLRNRREELLTLQERLEANDLPQVVWVAHRMIGVGTPYGIPYITNIGRFICEAAMTG